MRTVGLIVEAKKLKQSDKPKEIEKKGEEKSKK